MTCYIHDIQVWWHKEVWSVRVLQISYIGLYGCFKRSPFIYRKRGLVCGCISLVHGLVSLVPGIVSQANGIVSWVSGFVCLMPVRELGTYGVSWVRVCELLCFCKVFRGSAGAARGQILKM